MGAVREVTKDLRKESEIICEVCREPYSGSVRPYVSPKCGHSYCGYFDHLRSYEGHKAKCPDCRAAIGSERTFPSVPNIALSQKVEEEMQRSDGAVAKLEAANMKGSLSRCKSWRKN